ncbi:MAG: DUF2085 domain-containing protein [Ignavibacteriae bacterium]|nr:DUF2085 domain-containing protein [Ignavibacteriota bacterium]
MILKMLEDFQKNLFKYFQILVATIFILPFIAPIAEALGIHFVADTIYFLYSFSCHQLHWRSAHLFDHQLAWCIRDTFTWGGILASTFIVKRYKIKMNWLYLPIFVIPIALDGGIQTIATVFGFVEGESFYTSTNLLRAMTGAWFGLGVGMFLSSMVYELDAVGQLKDSLRSTLKFSSISLAGLFGVYLVLVQIWGLTTTNFKPANALDLAVRTPANIEERWVRQLNGSCEPDHPKDITSGNSLTEVVFSPADCF